MDDRTWQWRIRLLLTALHGNSDDLERDLQWSSGSKGELSVAKPERLSENDYQGTKKGVAK